MARSQSAHTSQARAERVGSALYIVGTPIIVAVLLWMIGVFMLAIAAIGAWVFVLVRLFLTERSDHPGKRSARLIAAAAWLAWISWFVVSSWMSGFGPDAWWEYWSSITGHGTAQTLSVAASSTFLLAGLAATIVCLVKGGRRVEL